MHEISSQLLAAGQFFRKMVLFCFWCMHFFYENTTPQPLQNFEVRTLVPIPPFILKISLTTPKVRRYRLQ